MKLKLMNIPLMLLSAMFLIGATTPAFAQQSITVNQTTPCFLNYTAGIEMWSNCGADEDWVAMALLPFEWITGGYFSMILVSLIVLGVYLKYHKVIYATGVGIVLLPVAFSLFPGEWLSFALLGVSLGVMAAIAFMVRDQVR